jgi:hypothetical protein
MVSSVYRRSDIPPSNQKPASDYPPDWMLHISSYIYIVVHLYIYNYIWYDMIWYDMIYDMICIYACTMCTELLNFHVHQINWSTSHMLIIRTSPFFWGVSFTKGCASQVFTCICCGSLAFVSLRRYCLGRTVSPRQVPPPSHGSQVRVER